MLTGLLPNPFTDEPWPGPGPALHEERIRTALAEAESNAQRAGLSVTSVLEAGDPKERLVERAKAWNADCIFLGARGLTGMDRFLLGSVSSAVAMRAPCSVEIVHGPAFH
jgi:nucleotide-binding universal stress UspA family protein